MQWIAVIITLPTQNATARMRIWRALKQLGCGVPRDGVYILPKSAAATAALEAQADEVRQAEGSAYVVEMSALDPNENGRFAALFDRSGDYAELIKAGTRFMRKLSTLTAPAIRRGLKGLQRDLAALALIDFFPNEASERANSTVQEVSTAAAALLTPDEPQPIDAAIPQLDRSDYRQRVWATRKDIWIDRIASAWLIRRFIDPQAQFIWLEKPDRCPSNALGFDFNGARFTHIGARVTFEVLLGSFGLADTALDRIAASIHYLDVGGIAPEDAPGLEAIFRGAKQRYPDDDVLLDHACGILDSLYASYSTEN